MNKNDAIEINKAFKNHEILGGRMVLQAFYNYVTEHFKSSTQEVAETFIELEEVLTRAIAELEG